MGGHSDELRRKDKVWQTMTKEQSRKRAKVQGPHLETAKGRAYQRDWSGQKTGLGWRGGTVDKVFAI